MIKRKYDTQLVHVEDVHIGGVKRWMFCETGYLPPDDAEYARFYIRLSGCVNVHNAFVIFGGPSVSELIGDVWYPCSYSRSGYASPPQIRVEIDGGIVEMEGEGTLVKHSTSMFVAGNNGGYYGPDIQLTIEEYILEGGERTAYVESCSVFRWIGDAFSVVSQILRDIGDRMGTVWFIGDVIQGWFNAAAGYFESTRDWFYEAADWCGGVVASLFSGDIKAWLQGFFADPGGYITGFLGDAWTWVQGLYSDFSGAVTDVLGDTWTWVQSLYNDFSGAVTDVLGGTWTWLQGLYSDFSGAIFDVLGSVWNDLQDMHTNFGSWVTGALGGTWDWLTEFVNDPMSKLSLDLLELVKSGFGWLTQEWFSFIDTSWDTFRGSFEWLLQKFFIVLDESWDNFEDTLKWFLGRCMDLVGSAAEELKYQIWDMVEKVVKKL